MAETQGFKARVEYEVTDGTQLIYTFPFSYLRKKFIKVDVLHADNSITPLTYGVAYVVNDLSLTLTNPAKVGEHLIIYRQTTTDKIITWNDGSILLASDMNIEDAQMLHLQEEQQDYIQAHSINTKTDSATKEVLWDALNHRVVNVSDPKDPQDAVTKHYMENVQGGFVAENTKILNEAKDTLSATQQTQSKAQANEALSKAWAASTESPDNADDTQSSTGKTQSSRSWALYSEGKAQESATSEAHAKTSETNAKASETKARLSEQNAKVSETNAKTSETNAKTSEQKAKTSETNAKTSETNASASASASASSASESTTSAANAHNSEVAAANSARQAATSEAHAKTSETNAKASETKARLSEQNAKVSETNAKTSETNAKTSEQKAKTSETNAKTSETNAKTSETNAKASEIKAETAETDALRHSSSAYSSYIKSRDWAESTGSPDGEDDSLSTTGKTRSARGWAEQARAYAGSFDLSFIINAVLPVGAIIEFVNNTDPNELYPGTTWVKMDAGRVLISAGTYTEKGTTYTYNLGDKGGEAKHQSTIDEIPRHSHEASCNTTGEHTHGYWDNQGGDGHQSYNGNASWDGWAQTGVAGMHTHTVTIASTGGDVAHENRQPFEVVHRWKRTV